MTQRPDATNPRHPKSRRWATLAEASNYIGLGQKTLRRRIADGDLTGYRAGPRQIRVDLDEIDAMLEPIPAATEDLR